MRVIDLHTWPRRQHFEVYRRFDHPHFNLCADVELTAFSKAVKESGVSLNAAIIYVLSRAANEIADFRLRIRGADVVEHELVHPSTTVLTAGDLFSFCTIPYQPDFPAFARVAAERIAFVKENPTLQDEPGQDNLLFMTSIPWVSFTSFTDPMNLKAGDSVPRFAWGKIFAAGERLKMPLSVQVHHALMDGVHLGRYYQLVQGYFDQPQEVLG